MNDLGDGRFLVAVHCPALWVSRILYVRWGLLSGG